MENGGASRWWLHESLTALNKSLSGHLCFARGDAGEILQKLVKETGATSVYWNRCYEPWRIHRDKKIKTELKASDIDVQSFNASLLFEPHTVLKDDGTPYKVFTPFYKRACLGRAAPPSEPSAPPKNIEFYKHEISSLEDLSLLPKIKWYQDMAEVWSPGEKGAKERLDDFLENGLKGYKEGRNFPMRENVSRLSPHLHFGEISPHRAWHQTHPAMMAQHCETDGENFLSELGWREFSNTLLYHFPDMTRKNLQDKFDNFPWRDDPEALSKWQKGQTGYPIVDAGMRELWQTGYMHNRVRMIVGSFLVKNLMLHWHHGEDWFWDTLCDADLANNSASWQWIAGCGADAAPYFRIFNPVTQGQKFDPDGEYVRQYVPELSDMPTKYIHAPWEAKEDMLSQSKVVLGKDYPHPIVDLKQSRERALETFKSLSS